MHSFLIAMHLVICFGLVVSVLLQSGKGGGLAGAFGGQGGGGQAIFGGRGAATFLHKATAVLGALFLLTALMLAILPRGGQGPARSLIQEQAQETQEAQPLTTPQGGTPVDAALPGAGTLPGEGTPAPAGGAEDDAQESEGGEPTTTGGSSGSQENEDG
jgi:preprotein translocase subunit SecG